MLTGDKIHLLWEAERYEKRIEVGGVVGEDYVILGEILCDTESIIELYEQEQRHGPAKCAIYYFVSKFHVVYRHIKSYRCLFYTLMTAFVKI